MKPPQKVTPDASSKPEAATSHGNSGAPPVKAEGQEQGTTQDVQGAATRLRSNEEKGPTQVKGYAEEFGKVAAGMAPKIREMMGEAPIKVNDGEVWRGTYQSGTFRVYLWKPAPWVGPKPILQRLISHKGEPETWQTEAGNQ